MLRSLNSIAIPQFTEGRIIPGDHQEGLTGNEGSSASGMGCQGLDEGEIAMALAGAGYGDP